MTYIASFPYEIRQIGPNAVQFETMALDGPFFAKDAIERLAPDLSAADKDMLADDIMEYALGQAIRHSVLINRKV